MNRRNFLAALASPFVGRLMPKREPSPMIIGCDPAIGDSITVIDWFCRDGRHFQKFADEPIQIREVTSPYWHGKPPYVWLNSERRIGKPWNFEGSSLEPFKVYSRRLS